MVHRDFANRDRCEFGPGNCATASRTAIALSNFDNGSAFSEAEKRLRRPPIRPSSEAFLGGESFDGNCAVLLVPAPYSELTSFAFCALFIRPAFSSFPKLRKSS